MSRNVSLWLLIVTVVAVGVLFVHVIRPFIVAIFLAMVLAVLFAPVHRWMTTRLSGRDRLASALTTIGVLIAVLLPISATLLMAGYEVMVIAKASIEWVENKSPQDVADAFAKIDPFGMGDRASDLYRHMNEQQRAEFHQAVSGLAQSLIAEVYERTRGMLSNMLTFVVSLAVMVLGLYYFLADRDLFLRETHRLLPLEDKEEGFLSDKFQNVARGVVLGTVVAGILQSATSGVAYLILGLDRVWLLMVLTMFCSFVPLLGPAIVWGLVSLHLLVTGHVAAGIVLAVYGATVVSSVDNLVRAYIIGHRARLHPFIALVTVLGAIRLVGLWGIFVGPMVAAFFYAFLNIMQSRVDQQEESETPKYLSLNETAVTNSSRRSSEEPDNAKTSDGLAFGKISQGGRC